MVPEYKFSRIMKVFSDILPLYPQEGGISPLVYIWGSIPIWFYCQGRACVLTFRILRWQGVVLHAVFDIIEDVVDALHALQLKGVRAFLHFSGDLVHAGLQLGVARFPPTPADEQTQNYFFSIGVGGGVTFVCHVQKTTHKR